MFALYHLLLLQGSRITETIQIENEGTLIRNEYSAVCIELLHPQNSLYMVSAFSFRLQSIEYGEIGSHHRVK